jgi:hypothetical protein
MEFIETAVFRKQVDEALSAEEFRDMQVALVARPDVGALIRGTGGLRKLRWAPQGRGKSGGVRVIYYWAVSDQVVYLLLLYAKNEQGDLTAAQEKQLRRLVEEEFG